MDQAVDELPYMRWSSVYGETPDQINEAQRESEQKVTEKFIAQRIRLKQHYGWLELDVVSMKSLSGWSALVRFQARAAMKPVVPVLDYERKPATTAAHGYGSPVPQKPELMDTSDENSASARTPTRRRVRPLEMST